MTEFACPRCGAATSAEFYAPCATCCAALNEAQRIEPRVIEGANNEGRMHVVPNAVALPAED